MLVLTFAWHWSSPSWLGIGLRICWSWLMAGLRICQSWLGSESRCLSSPVSLQCRLVSPVLVCFWIWFLVVSFDLNLAFSWHFVWALCCYFVFCLCLTSFLCLDSLVFIFIWLFYNKARFLFPHFLPPVRICIWVLTLLKQYHNSCTVQARPVKY